MLIDLVSQMATLHTAGDNRNTEILEYLLQGACDIERMPIRF